MYIVAFFLLAATSDCEAIYQAVTDAKAFPAPEKKIQHLLYRGRSCRGTGIYESRLAYFYVQAGDLDAAVKVLNQGLSTPNDYQKELKYSLADIDVAKGDLDKGFRNATRLKDEYPDWFGGYVLLAKVTLMQRRFAESIQYGTEANKRSPNASTFLGLAIAHHQLDQDEQAIAAGLEAIERDPKVVAAGAGMNEMIYSYVRLNRYPQALDLLEARIRHDAAWRNDPVFVKAYDYLRAKLPAEFDGIPAR